MPQGDVLEHQVAARSEYRGTAVIAQFGSSGIDASRRDGERPHQARLGLSRARMNNGTRQTEDWAGPG